jgi:uncharacterized protein (DUF952 family)
MVSKRDTGPWRHVKPGAKWEQAVAEGEYRADTLATEGFIHCCSPAQPDSVYERYFHGRQG